MAVRDTWNRALVYFGLAEDHDYRYEDEYDPYEPDTVSRGGGACSEPPPP